VLWQPRALQFLLEAIHEESSSCVSHSTRVRAADRPSVHRKFPAGRGGTRNLEARLANARDLSSGYRLGIRRYTQSRRHSPRQQGRDAYRAQDTDGVSRLGYADSTDGIHFARKPEPGFAPEAYEIGGGVEDPRLVKIDRLYYMTYSGYNKQDAQLCLATSRDLIHWDRKGILLPAYKGKWNSAWTKSGAILTEKIDGKYWMYWLGTSRDHKDEMGLSHSYDLVHWTEATEIPCSRPARENSIPASFEPGPPPILTPEGIVLIYNGADDILLFTAPASPSSTAKIPASFSIAPNNPFSRHNSNGKKWARFPTLYSSKEC
jgi:hypothetical protein